MSWFFIFAVVVGVIMASERIANAIPDEKTGFLGNVRKFFRVVSAKTPNL